MERSPSQIRNTANALERTIQVSFVVSPPSLQFNFFIRKWENFPSIPIIGNPCFFIIELCPIYFTTSLKGQQISRTIKRRLIDNPEERLLDYFVLRHAHPEATERRRNSKFPQNVWGRYDLCTQLHSQKLSLAHLLCFPYLWGIPRAHFCLISDCFLRRKYERPNLVNFRRISQVQKFRSPTDVIIGGEKEVGQSSYADSAQQTCP